MTLTLEKAGPPPPPDHDAQVEEAEVEEQAVDRTSVGKKPWTKPTITAIDDMEHFEGGPAPDNANENSAYFVISV